MLEIYRRLLTAILLLAPAIVGLTACGTSPVNVSQTLPVLAPQALATFMNTLLAPVLHTQPRPDVVLLGEQHDAPQHHQLERAAVTHLIRQGRLGALAVEMAERGRSTAGLGVDASEDQVQRALGWNNGAWPWENYGPTLMLAVREAIPVLGANLPRSQQRDAMKNEALDQALTAQSLEKQRQAIVDGHCGLLVSTQIAPMARIQIARDRAMAQTVTEAARRTSAAFEDRALGKPVVLLLAGRGHVDRMLGVPVHLNADIKVRTIAMAGQTEGLASANAAGRFDAVWPTEPAPAKDYCEEFRNSRPTNPNASANTGP